jgi:putative acetyltransferase
MSGVMVYNVVPAEERYYASLHEALDSVAREKKFLSTTKAPPLEQSVAFYKALAAAGMAHYLVLEGERVVGWVDVARTFGQSRAHVGILGMALIGEARHKGLGSVLLAAAIAHSWKQGLSRLELTVRADNLNAQALYKRFGFQQEGVLRNGCLVDGQYFDMHFMALLRQNDA